MKDKLKELYYEVSADIEHGECFYDEEMFEIFLANLDQLKEVAQRLFYENQDDEEEETV